MTTETQVTKLEPSQHHAAGEMLGRAFFDDPLSVYLVPDERKRARVLPWMYERVVRYGSMYDGELLTTNLPSPLAEGPGDRSHSPIASSPLPRAGEGPGVRAETRRGAERVARDVPSGVAVWLPPGLAHAPILRLVRAGLALTPLKFGLGAMGRFMATNHVERLRKQLAPEPHWYLWVIGVDPPRQGRGLGSSLVQPMLERAGADGLPCYLETHKSRNVTFYEKHGFSVIALGDVPKGGPPYWCMKREARR